MKKICDNSDLESFFTVFAIDPSTSYVATAMAGIGLNNSLAVDGDTIQGNSAPSNNHENQISEGGVDFLMVNTKKHLILSSFSLFIYGFFFKLIIMLGGVLV